MKENLEIEPHEMVKTFDFNANEEYTSKVTGEGITTGGRLETMPTFIGASVSEVEAWANSHNITLYTEFVNETDANYNASIAPGLVANQSIANGILLNNVSSLTIYINNASTTIEEPTTPPKDENNTDKNNTNPTNPNDKNENEEQDNETNEPDDPLDVILPSDKPENNSGSSSESSESNNSNNNTTNENQSH